MKRDVWLFLLALALTVGLGSCSDDRDDSIDPKGNINDSELNGTTYVGLTLRVPAGTMLRAGATDDQDYNYQGSYSGYIGVDHLDLYLYSADGTTQLMAKRFTTLGTDFTLELKNGQEFIEIAAPFKANPGEVMGVVIINCNNPLAGVSSNTDIFSEVIYKNVHRSTDYNSLLGDGYISGTQVSSGLIMSTVSNTDYITDPTDGRTTVYKETIIMSGKSDNPFIIQDNVSREDVITGRMNVLTMDVTKIVSKAIVTYGATAQMRLYKDPNGPQIPAAGWEDNVYGTISNVTYSVAQGGNSGYLFRRFTPEGRTMSWAYEFVPGPATGNDYGSNASTYYEYGDLNNTSRIVPLMPNGVNVAAYPGVYLMPNTHQWGAELASTGYRKGNTAYALIRAKFTPDPSAIYNNASLAADGTFYFGYLDRLIYATLEDAQNAAGSAFSSQPVQTYVGGKMMYYVWLNPDNADDPTKWTNSPVIRNNIYHINIRSFNNLGTNWNPLVPPDVSNPDPKPGGPEPPTPVDPTDPIGDTNTYMSVDIQAIPWTVHSYDKVL